MANSYRSGLILQALFLFSSLASAQYTKYLIQFTDRNNNPYSISDPSQYLSARAIQRRVNQNISIMQNDLPVTPAYVDSVAKVPNVTVLARTKWFNGVIISTTDTNALAKIRSYPFVYKSKPVERIGSGGKGKFDDETVLPGGLARGNGPVSASSYNYGAGWNQINMLNGICLHDKGYRGEGMVIAVMDAGFKNVNTLGVFDSIRANGQLLGGWNFTTNDTMVYNSSSHGEMVLSTMAGNIPGKIVGTAPGAKYWLFVSEASAENIVEEYYWACSAEFADSAGADVLSTSLGYTVFDSVMVNNVKIANPENHTYADMNGRTAPISRAHAIAASKGMLPVCSAGNSGWGAWHYIGAPADADSTLAIGAVDSMKNFAGFSSYGPSSDGRVKPNVAAQGYPSAVIDANSGEIVYASGTSFSCPITAGMVACLWQSHPMSTNMQVLGAVQQSASQYMNPDTLKGFGIPDFCAAELLLAIRDHSAVSEEVLSVYPNPFYDRFDISFFSWKGEMVSLVLHDAMGRKIAEKRISAKTNVSSVPMENLSRLAPGLYVLTAEIPGQKFSVKLVRY